MPSFRYGIKPKKDGQGNPFAPIFAENPGWKLQLSARFSFGQQVQFLTPPAEGLRALLLHYLLFVILPISCYAFCRRWITMTTNMEYIQNGDYLNQTLHCLHWWSKCCKMRFVQTSRLLRDCWFTQSEQWMGAVVRLYPPRHEHDSTLSIESGPVKKVIRVFTVVGRRVVWNR